MSKRVSLKKGSKLLPLVRNGSLNQDVVRMKKIPNVTDLPREQMKILTSLTKSTKTQLVTVHQLIDEFHRYNSRCFCRNKGDPNIWGIQDRPNLTVGLTDSGDVRLCLYRTWSPSIGC